MAGYRGSTYTPFFAQGMGGIASAIDERRERGREQAVRDLAANAWMGDPEAMQELATMDPNLALKIEDQAAQRSEVEQQRTLDKDKRFVEDLDTAMAQIGAFENYEQAKAYGQRITDMLMQKYPERMAQRGQPAEFTEDIFNEIRTITGGATGEPVGVPFRAVDAEGRAVMAQQKKLPNGRTITQYLTDEEGNLVRPAEYDAGLVYEKAGAAKQAQIDLLDDEALAKLSAEAKTKIMPARKSAQETIGMITAMKNHPGLDWVVGWGRLNPARFLPGTPAKAFAVLAEQARGKVFAQAYETLKGGGPITEIESRMASQAIARMDKSQSKEEYMAALNDFETAIRRGYDILLKQAAGEFEVDKPLDERPESAARYTRSNPAAPKTPEEYQSLPSGAYYRTPKGDIRRKK